MHFFSHGICDSAAHAAADDRDFFKSVRFGRFSERADEIVNEIAFFEVIEFFGGGSDDLEYNGHPARFPIVIGDSQRNAFAVGVNSQNNELTRFGLFCDERRFDVHTRNSRIQALFS